ncbi:GNAT family N-acetyltransferase [Microbulbifer sp. OS29]|uniref:GNAT family N-acetyltransferase n=1 Tax=Microbulbifer okhotskensis TaxID=2926617 RepID=A0A9X2ELQ4_9GAMM|nr:GNAT family N-acetyltransferase [Microbulbifer okhotskensis]MCO1334549.1 GNAT family N-acetyltransferase [Microbulbifer okhotskensis]
MEHLSLKPIEMWQFPILMSWLPDREQCQQWGGPDFRFPFNQGSFLEDCRWPELPSYALQDSDGDVLAFGQYYQHLGRCHLSRLIVSPSHRGAGLGRALVTQLAQTGASALDATECSLFVLRTNTAARTLYEKLGFVGATYPGQREWLDRCDFMVAPSRAFQKKQNTE